MEFDRFNRLLQAHVATVFKSETTLFVTDADKETLWNLYLDSFPAGTNQIFRLENHLGIDSITFLCLRR